MKKIANPRQSRNLIFNLSFGAAAAALAIAFMLIAVASQPAQAQTFTVLHNFTGGQDGATPEAGLTFDKAGNLYGTTWVGGTSGDGAVFQLKRKNSSFVFNPLYSFAGGNDGANPTARVVFGPNGTLYGTTTNGGTAGGGTVFNLRPQPRACTAVLCPWMKTVLYSFQGSPNDGAAPEYGDLNFDQAPNMYGTTASGGTSAVGTVFELVPSGNSYTESVLYNFSGLDGRHPYSGVIFDSTGQLFGTSYDGAPTGGGTVYQLTPSGSGWTETTLFSFFDDANGDYPWSGLILDPQSGNLYGATSDAGANGGTVFELSPPGSWTTLKVLYSFTGPFNHRSGPRGTVVMNGGNLYGTTYCDGANDLGSVWELMPSGSGWTYKTLHDFTGGSDGSYPFGNVVLDANGNLYGTASAGGAQGKGVVWEITP